MTRNTIEEKNKKEARERAVRLARSVSDRKAQDVVVLEVSALTSFADYFVICEGKSSRQVQGIADHMEEELRKAGIRPLGSEGRKEGHWVLVDYGDVIVHVFYEPVRAVFDLESLWSEAERVLWEPDNASASTSTTV